MTLIAATLLASMLLVPFHILGMAGAASSLGVGIREISFGYGREIKRHGKVTLRWFLPLGGYCKFRDTRTDPSEPSPIDQTGAPFNEKPRLVRAAIPLAGSVALVLMSVFIVGPEQAARALLSGFRQIVLGGVLPFSNAQEYLRIGSDLLNREGALSFFGVFAAKLAAANLLPLPNLNGGQAISALIRPSSEEWQAREERLLLWLIWPWILLLASWLIAITIYAAAG